MTPLGSLLTSSSVGRAKVLSGATSPVVAAAVESGGVGIISDGALSARSGDDGEREAQRHNPCRRARQYFWRDRGFSTWERRRAGGQESEESLVAISVREERATTALVVSAVL